MDVFALKMLADEELEYILIHLDFNTQCKLRRTCRRWRGLLQSETVLQSAIFIVPSCRKFPLVPVTASPIDYTVLRTCLQRGNPYLKIVLFTRHATTEFPTDSWPWMHEDAGHQHFGEIFERCIDNRRAGNSIRQIVLANLCLKLTNLLMVHIPKSVTKFTLVRVQLSIDTSFGLGRGLFPMENRMELYLLDVSASTHSAITVIGPYTFTPPAVSGDGFRYVMGYRTTTPTELQVFWDFFRVVVPSASSADERQSVYDYIAWMSEDKVARQTDLVHRLEIHLRKYQPDLFPNERELNLWRIICGQFNPVVRRAIQRDLIQLALAHHKNMDTSIHITK